MEKTETYQSNLSKDKYAKIALNLPAKYKLQGKSLHDCAFYIAEIEFQRELEGKETSHDHLIQIAVKWCKEESNKNLKE